MYACAQEFSPTNKTEKATSAHVIFSLHVDTLREKERESDAELENNLSRIESQLNWRQPNAKRNNQFITDP